MQAFSSVEQSCRRLSCSCSCAEAPVARRLSFAHSVMIEFTCRRSQPQLTVDLLDQKTRYKTIMFLCRHDQPKGCGGTMCCDSGGHDLVWNASTLLPRCFNQNQGRHTVQGAPCFGWLGDGLEKCLVVSDVAFQLLFHASRFHSPRPSSRMAMWRMSAGAPRASDGSRFRLWLEKFAGRASQ